MPVYCWDDFKNWIAMNIALRLPNRVKYWTIINTNTTVWVEAGTITPDEVTWKMLCDRFGPNQKSNATCKHL